MKIKRALSLLLALLMVMSLLTSCGQKPTNPAADEDVAAGDKPVVIYCSALMTSLNAFTATGYPDRFIATNVYETLATVDNDGNVNPCLAKSWDVSDDALVYTFHLVDNATFHNGETVKASDVVFSYEYAKNYPQADKFINMVDSVKAIDDTTVEFTLKNPSPMFLMYTMDVQIFCESFVKASSDPDMKSVECGSGPYKVTSFDGANHCYLEAYEDYRDGAPAIKNAEFRYVSDAASAAVSFEAGEITVMDSPIAQGKVLIDSGKYNYEYRTPLHTAIIAFNCTVAPFDNKLVRKALSYAADKDTIIAVAYEGMAIPARIQAGENCFGVDFSESENISYNPEKAKELLAEAGYPDGLDLTAMGIEFKTIAGGYHEKIAQVYQQNLADIGVTVELISTETPDEDVVAGDFAIMNEGLSYQPDFSNNQNHYCTKAIGASNMGHWSDAYVDEMFAKADAETDTEARKAIYRELIAYIIDACPTLPIMHRQAIYLFDKNLNASFYDSSAHPYRIWEWSWNN